MHVVIIGRRKEGTDTRALPEEVSGRVVA